MVDHFGGPGTKGGEFNRIRDIAVNRSGAGPAAAGDIYVADEFNNRVQRFDSEGNFISAWGADVSLPDGGAGFELCTEASECQQAAAAAGGGTAAGNGDLDSPQSLAVDDDSGEVYVSDRDNRRVNVYDGAGAFIRSFGWDVAEAGPGNTGTGYEVCEDAEGDVCKAGVGSTTPGAGQFHSSAPEGDAYGIALSPPDGEAAAGKVFLANSGARRVESFDLDGANPANFGSEAVFGAEQPRNVAVDSRGILYASNDKKGGEIERYDSEDANGGGVGFLAPISATIAGTNEKQKLKFTGFSASSTFTLSCPGGGTTDPIAYDPFAVPLQANIEAALEAECGPSFSVTQEPTITFKGGFATTNVPTTVCTKVKGPGSCSVTEEIDGVPTIPGALLAGTPASATAGLEVDPDSDEGGPETDVLHVLRDPSPGDAVVLPSETVVQQFGPVNAPGLSAAPTADDDRHGEGAGFAFAATLGLDEASGRLLIGAANRVYILEEAPAPGASLDPVAEFDAHAATFSGTVDPNGVATGYRFEYVDDAEFQANGFENASPVPIADADAGEGEDPVAVEHETPHTLIPGTLYHVRLLAKRTLSLAGAIGGPQTFTTPGAAPAIDGTAATVSTAKATLRGAIDPENEAVTGYHFEWGTSASYGNSTPAGNLASGAGPVAVSAELTGLTPGQAYHYRLLATNGAGTTTGPDRTFATYLQLPGLGPERAYELVSRYPTGGTPIISITGRQTASEDGERLVIGSAIALSGSTLPALPDDPHRDGAGGPLQYESVRGPDGWQVTETGIGGTSWSADASRLLAVTGVNGDEDVYGRLDPDDQNSRDDLYQRRPDGTLVWISRDPRIPVGTPQTAPGRAVLAANQGSATMSADGRTVVFRSERQLSDADTTPGTTSRRLYKWTEGEGAKFIGARPDGSVPAGGTTLGSVSEVRHAVSSDGSRVVFGAKRTDGGDQGKTLYIQSDGAPTVEAVKETGVPPLPKGQPYNPIYRAGASDTSRVFYTTASRLTPDSGANFISSFNNDFDEDLYAYDIGAGKVRDLTPRLDGIEDPEVDPAKADRGRALGVAASSEDGKRVYFVADARYETAPNPQGDLPSPEGRNLYLAELDGIDDPIELRFIAAPLAGAPARPRLPLWGDRSHRDAQAPRRQGDQGRLPAHHQPAPVSARRRAPLPRPRGAPLRARQHQAWRPLPRGQERRQHDRPDRRHGADQRQGAHAERPRRPESDPSRGDGQPAPRPPAGLAAARPLRRRGPPDPGRARHRHGQAGGAAAVRALTDVPADRRSDVDLLAIVGPGRDAAEVAWEAQPQLEAIADAEGDSPVYYSLRFFDAEFLRERRAIRDFFLQEVDRDKLVLYGNDLPGYGGGAEEEG